MISTRAQLDDDGSTMFSKLSPGKLGKMCASRAVNDMNHGHWGLTSKKETECLEF